MFKVFTSVFFFCRAQLTESPRSYVWQISYFEELIVRVDSEYVQMLHPASKAWLVHRALSSFPRYLRGLFMLRRGETLWHVV